MYCSVGQRDEAAASARSVAALVVAAGPVGMVVTAAREAVEKVGQKVEVEVEAAEVGR